MRNFLLIVGFAVSASLYAQTGPGLGYATNFSSVSYTLDYRVPVYGNLYLSPSFFYTQSTLKTPQEFHIGMMLHYAFYSIDGRKDSPVFSLDFGTKGYKLDNKIFTYDNNNPWMIGISVSARK